MGIKTKKTDEFSFRPFDKLKKQIERARPTPPPAQEPPKGLPSSDDEIFTTAMSDVREIEGFRVLPCSKPARREAPARKKTDPDDEALRILEQIASGEQPINLSDTQEYVEWTNPGYRQGVTADLHIGRYSVQGMLDLHGLTGNEVNEELDGFLATAFTKGWRCVKVIHGRGLRSVKGPVLKDAVIRRLLGRYRKDILAFVSARQCDGGVGALYVLLNR
jgi:DNA-nicking Smr family endonuclease